MISFEQENLFLLIPFIDEISDEEGNKKYVISLTHTISHERGNQLSPG